jgi:putative spermidine/putrescine transport system ATP-binding protein
VSFGYNGVPALHECDVSVSPGRAVVLVGPSGAGKTTLLWLLAGLWEPDAGRVGVVQRDGEWHPVPAGQIGMVFQQPMLWEHLSVEQHLKLVLAGKDISRPKRRRQIEAVLSRMMLQPLRRRTPGQLSGGERQRLAIARAIVARPRWLLLDEPLAHLDGPARAGLLNLLREILRETYAGVILATHNATDALRLGEEVCVMLGRRIAQRGTGEEVYRRPVSADVASVLGPVSVLHGQAQDGSFWPNAGDGHLLGNLDATLSGRVLGLLRPDDLRFHFEESGPVQVIEVEYIGNGYHLWVDIPGGGTLLVRSDTFRAKGTLGMLTLTRPNAGYWRTE